MNLRPPMFEVFSIRIQGWVKGVAINPTTNVQTIFNSNSDAFSFGHIFKIASGCEHMDLANVTIHSLIVRKLSQSIIGIPYVEVFFLFKTHAKVYYRQKSSIISAMKRRLAHIVVPQPCGLHSLWIHIVVAQPLIQLLHVIFMLCEGTYKIE